jgi:hypothetical protein
MILKLLIWLLATVALTTASIAEAQQSLGNVPRIGFLTSGSRAGIVSGRQDDQVKQFLDFRL